MHSLENLENRRLLAFAANINFQPDGTSVPSGYKADAGYTYGQRANGLTYGWNSDNRANTRDRNVNSDQRLDTLNHMQKGGDRRWEIAVPNGRYRVTLSAGDASFADSKFRINVEGVLAIDKTPTSSSRFASSTISVNVNDGRLTVSNASGAVNNKINYVQVEQTVTNPPPTNTPKWSRGADMPVALGEVAAGVINNKLYVVGDGNSKTLVYDLSSKTWRDNLAQRQFPAKDQVAEVVNGRLYVFGGVKYSSGSQNAYDYTQIYNPATNSWSQGARMPFKAFASQTAVINGEIYLAGGITQGNFTTNRVAKYNPSSNTWTNLASMPGIGRNSAPAGTDGKYLFVFGGRVRGDNPENGRTDILLYNPMTNRWVTGMTADKPFAALPIGRGGTVKAPYVNGEFYLIGGEDLTRPLSRVDTFNPQTNAFRRLPDMPTARHGIYPVFANNAIHVPGGGATSGYSQSRVFESLAL
jgi:hypothetical protein